MEEENITNQDGELKIPIETLLDNSLGQYRVRMGYPKIVEIDGVRYSIGFKDCTPRHAQLGGSVLRFEIREQPEDNSIIQMFKSYSPIRWERDLKEHTGGLYPGIRYQLIKAETRDDIPNSTLEKINQAILDRDFKEPTVEEERNLEKYRRLYSRFQI